MNRYIFHIIAFWLYNTDFGHAFLSKKHYFLILSYFLTYKLITNHIDNNKVL